MSDRLIITGTDTDAGKTVLAAALARAAVAAGRRVLLIKPVQTGARAGYFFVEANQTQMWAPPTPARALPALDPANLETVGKGEIHDEGCRAMGTPVGGAGESGLYAPDLAVYREAAPNAQTLALELFIPACSPHLAARAAGRCLTAANLARRVLDAVEAWETSQTDKAPGLVLLEGAGGLLTPVSESETLRDLFTLLGWPVLLAAANRLGVVNHALLSLEGIRAANLECAGLVMVEPSPPETDEERRMRADNPAIIATFGRVPHCAAIPFLPGLQTGRGAYSNGRQGNNPPDSPGDKQSNTQNATWDTAAACVAPLLASCHLHREPSHPESSESIKNVQTPVWGFQRGSPPLAAGGNSNSGIISKSEHPAATPPAAGSAAEALRDFDRAHIWHPYTSALAPLNALEAVSTLGTRIRLRDGRELVDGMASWWCAIHGYGHPALMEALREQADRMPHVMFGGLTHEPAVNLARALLSMSPPGLEHVFFADSGSVSVEVGIKMALQYQQAAGHTGRTRLLALRGGYHGDTLGAMSVCDPENGMHGLFSGILPRQIFAPRPECRFDAPYDPASEKAFADVLEEHADSVAAVVLEPVVQGAGGMWFYHPDFLRAVRGLCDRHGCLLVLDEIATGFGRTGALFACEHAGVAPDIMCVGKGLTGGVMTLAATLATREVAEGISRGGGVLMHGPTFMANPLACAVAGASLGLLARGGWKSDVERIAAGLRAGLAPCAGRPGVADVRVLGAIGVVETERPVNMERLQAFFVRQGVWIRPFGQLLYVMPPYVTPDADIDLLCSALRGAVEQGAWE